MKVQEGQSTGHSKDGGDLPRGSFPGVWSSSYRKKSSQKGQTENLPFPTPPPREDDGVPVCFH